MNKKDCYFWNHPAMGGLSCSSINMYIDLECENCEGYKKGE